MADRSIQRQNERAELAEDDPFAELTRIMGHDPRASEPAGSAPEGEEPVDLAADLENEMFGSLEADEDPATAEHEPAATRVDWGGEAGAGDDWTAETDFAPDGSDDAVPAEAEDVPFDEDAFADAAEPDFAPSGRDDDAAGDTQSTDWTAFDRAYAPLPEDGSVRYGAAREPQAGPFEDLWPSTGSDTPDAYDASGAGEEEEAVASDEPAAAEDWAEPAPAAEEPSLEDELNALLAETASPQATGYAPAPIDEAASAELESAANAFDYSRASAARPPLFEDDEGESARDPVNPGTAFDAALAGQSGAEAEAEAAPPSASATPSASRFFQRSNLRPAAQAATAATAAPAADASNPYARFLDEPAREPPELEAEPDAEIEADLGPEIEPEHAAEPVAEASEPELDIVDIPEGPTVVNDDLDIPELEFAEDAPPADEMDEIDREFAAAFGEPTDNGPAEDADEEFDALFRELSTDPVSHAAPQAELHDDEAQATAPAAEPDQDHDDNDALPLAAAMSGAPAAAATPASLSAAPGRFEMRSSERVPMPGEPAYDDGSGGDDIAGLDDLDLAGDDGEDGRSGRSRGYMIAAVVAGIAIIGGIGAFALSYGGGGDVAEAPAIVAADDEPVRVRPEEPGGTAVPNQDGAVYERVAGGPNEEEPAQEELVQGSEEPVDLAARTEEPRVILPGSGEETTAPEAAEEGVEVAPAAGQKSEERIEQVAESELTQAEQEMIAVAPRRVRTMIVRPDGTMVPREDPEATAQDPAGPTIARAQEEGAGDQVSLLSPAEPAPVQEDGGSLVETPPTAPIATARPETGAGSDAPGPVAAADPAPARPASPAAEPAATAVSSPATTVASEWSMQIASQPTPEGARATYQELSQRYGSVLAGRGVNIVRAEIEGKGTYYRVRIPAESRDDAIQLCSRYKSIGGNCFVSR